MLFKRTQVSVEAGRWAHSRLLYSSSTFVKALLLKRIKISGRNSGYTEQVAAEQN